MRGRLNLTASPSSTALTANTQNEVEELVEDRVETLRHRFRITDDLVRCVLCEFFCTAFLLFFGLSVVAQFYLSERTQDEWVCVAVGWGIALALAVQMGFRISGAHMNPAVSLLLLSQGRLSWKKFFYYVIAQHFGAFCGALFTYVEYYGAIRTSDAKRDVAENPLGTAVIFCTFPSEHVSTIGAVVDQIVATTMLTLCISIITDHRSGIPTVAQPWLMGVMLTLLNMAFVHNASGAMNPARDLAPRALTLLLGYGHQVFSYRDYMWWWVPVVCPLIGGILGGWLYSLFIGFHVPDRELERPPLMPHFNNPLTVKESSPDIILPNA